MKLICFITAIFAFVETECAVKNHFNNIKFVLDTDAFDIAQIRIQYLKANSEKLNANSNPILLTKGKDTKSYNLSIDDLKDFDPKVDSLYITSIQAKKQGGSNGVTIDIEYIQNAKIEHGLRIPLNKCKNPASETVEIYLQDCKKGEHNCLCDPNKPEVCFKFSCKPKIRIK